MGSGIVVPVLQYTAFNHSFLKGGAFEEVIVADRIPVAPFTRIGGSIRIHQRNLAAGASYQVIVRGINPSDQDGADFVFGTDLGSITAITSTVPTNVPALVQLSAIITDPQHPMVRVVVKATGSSATGNVYIILSGDLVMKTG